MGLSDLISKTPNLEILRRSLERQRVGHAYLFTGRDRTAMVSASRTFAKALNCIEHKSKDAEADCCNQCHSCERIQADRHSDVHWVRPESKTRVIKIQEIRQLTARLQLKSNDARCKVGIIVDADRMPPQSANAFLKTLEEPPSNSLMILLSTQPDQLLDTIQSRCLHLHFHSDEASVMRREHQAWLETFAQQASVSDTGMLGRYKVMDILLTQLAQARQSIEEDLKARSIEAFPKEADPEIMKKRDDELKASIESEYRRQRGAILTSLEWWFRDTWLIAMNAEARFLTFPDLQKNSHQLADRLDAQYLRANIQVIETLQRVLNTNAQEALALEVNLLKLHL